MWLQSSKLLLDIYREMKTYVHQKTCTKMHLYLWYPPIGINPNVLQGMTVLKAMAHLYHGIIHYNKKEKAIDTHNSLDEPPENCAEWKKKKKANLKRVYTACSGNGEQTGGCQGQEMERAGWRGERRVWWQRNERDPVAVEPFCTSLWWWRQKPPCDKTVQNQSTQTYRWTQIKQGIWTESADCINVDIPICDMALQIYKMWPLEETGGRVHGISVYFFLRMHVNLRLFHKKFQWKKSWSHYLAMVSQVPSPESLGSNYVTVCKGANS